MSNHLFDKANELINGASTIVIATHVNTDGDAVGSSLGLYNYLKDIGKNVDIFIDSVIPENLITLPGVDEINNKKSNKTNNYEKNHHHRSNGSYVSVCIRTEARICGLQRDCNAHA